MKQYYIVCDISLCHDCNNCFMACKDEHVDNKWLPYTHAQPRHGHRWINILRRERGQAPRIDVAYLPLTCKHCEQPACAEAHPQLITRREDGIVQIDTSKAIGYKPLAYACPYGTMYWNEAASIAQKCTMCAHILDGEGADVGIVKMPRCVHSCPTNALEFFHLEPADMDKKIQVESLRSYIPKLDSAFANGVRANVYFKNLDRFEKAFIAGGLLKDGECAEGVGVSLMCEDCNDIYSTQITDCFGDFKFDGLEPGNYIISVGGRELKKVTVEKSLNVGNLLI